jgi:hypothetical protein
MEASLYSELTYELRSLTRSSTRTEVSSVVRTVTAPKSSGAPNGRFLHPIRALFAGAGSVAGNELSLWEVPTNPYTDTLEIFGVRRKCRVRTQLQNRETIYLGVLSPETPWFLGHQVSSFAALQRKKRKMMHSTNHATKCMVT